MEIILTGLLGRSCWEGELGELFLCVLLPLVVLGVQVRYLSLCCISRSTDLHKTLVDRLGISAVCVCVCVCVCVLDREESVRVCAPEDVRYKLSMYQLVIVQCVCVGGREVGGIEKPKSEVLQLDLFSYSKAETSSTHSQLPTVWETFLSQLVEL